MRTEQVKGLWGLVSQSFETVCIMSVCIMSVGRLAQVFTLELENMQKR